MKLHLSNTDGRSAITGYGPGYVEINARRYETNVVVLPTSVESALNPCQDGNFGTDTVTYLATLDIEIVLLGTGSTQRFPPPATLRPLIEAGIGFEIMDTKAACRTFNILVAEDRRVAAALLL